MTLLGIIYLIISPFSVINMFLYNYDSSMEIGYNEEGGYGDFIHHSTLHISAFETPVIMYYWKKYFSNKQWGVFLLVSVIALFFTLFLARRGQLLIYFTYFSLCYFLYLMCDKQTSKLISLLSGGVILIIGVVFVIIGSDSFLSLIFERGMGDSRSGVEQNFYNSMDLQCLIFGRGWFGQYYDDMFGNYRNGIETGYLTLILRGGIIYLVLYVSLLLYSGCRGLFFSKSIFVKSYAIMIIVSILSLYPFGWPAYDFYFFIIWMGVYICNNEYYLKLTDFQVKLLFNKDADIVILWLLNALYRINKGHHLKDQLVK